MRRPVAPREPFELNLTPMIDVVFQLLIFFVCTVEFQKREDVLDANLATPGLGAAAVPRSPQELDLGRIEIEVLPEKVLVRFQGRERQLAQPNDAQTLQALRKMLHEWRQIDERIPVRIQCRPEVATGTLLRLYDGCLQAGLVDVGLSQQP